MGDDIGIDAKRVYAAGDGSTAAYVASDVGLARVAVSDDIVGEFSLVYTGPVADVATTDGRVAVATPEDVLVGSDDAFAETGFGPATAVGFDDGLLAAGDGRLARYDDEWRTLGRLDDVRAIEGELVAAASGVHRPDGSHAGLEDARDVATRGSPLVATGSGLYSLANGWTRALDGAFHSVDSRPDGTAHAASGELLYERAGPDAEWRAVDLPVEGEVADVAHAAGTYAVTVDGTFLADAGDGWRHRSLGLPDVTGLAVRRR